MNLSYSPSKIVFYFKFKFELSLFLSALSILYIYIYKFNSIFYTYISTLPLIFVDDNNKIQENVQTVCIIKCSLKQHRPAKTAAQTTTFRSELRSCVKVEVAVLGSRP